MTIDDFTAALNDAGWNDILVLRRNQIDHIGEQELGLIERLHMEDIPASDMSERHLEWLVELDVVSVENGMVSCKHDVVVIEPIVYPGEYE